MEDDPYYTGLHMEDDGTGTLWMEPVYGALPDVLAFELGEMLYQLRAALDSAVYAAAILQSGQDPPPDEKNLEFPIRATEREFNNARWHIRPLPDECKAIIESIQPYKVVQGLLPELLVLSPHRSIGILNDWARKDRHRRLHVVGSWASNINPWFTLPEGCELEYVHLVSDGFIHHASNIATFKVSGFRAGMEPKVYANPNLAIDVAVDDAPLSAADNDTLNNRIRMMIIYTKEIIHAFESVFANPGGKP